MEVDMDFRETVVTDLKHNVCDIVFTKTNGEERIMRCTLMEKFLPETKDHYTTKKENLEVVPVWDLEKNAWRSFRLDSVIKIIVHEEDTDVAPA